VSKSKITTNIHLAFEQIKKEADLSHFSESQIFKHISDNSPRLEGSAIPPKLGFDQSIVLCVVKNGEVYARKFIEYYQNLGVDHIIFLDNGSTDDTMKIAMEYEQVTIFQTLLPYKVFFQAFKRYLINVFAYNTWALVVDIDEFFSYPFDEYLSFHNFINYLNNHNFNAVVTQMLDLFPEKDLLDSSSISNTEFREVHRFYNSKSVERYKYNITENFNISPKLNTHVGGVRKSEFNVDSIALTKHALLRFTEEIEIPNDHELRNARVADVSTLLLHYKFVGDFVNYFKKSVAEGNHFNNSAEYKKYVDKIESSSTLVLYNEDCRQITSSSELIEDGFIIISPNYYNYLLYHESSNILIELDSEIIKQLITSGGDLLKEFKPVLENELAVEKLLPESTQVIIKEIDTDENVAKKFHKFNLNSASLDPSELTSENHLKLIMALAEANKNHKESIENRNWLKWKNSEAEKHNYQLQEEIKWLKSELSKLEDDKGLIKESATWKIGSIFVKPMAKILRSEK